MNSRKSARTTPFIQRCVDYIRQKPAIQSIIYLGGSVVTAFISSSLEPDRTAPYEVVRFHSRILPMILIFTSAYKRLFPIDTPASKQNDNSQKFTQLLIGAGLGTSAYLTFVGIAAAQRWVSFPGWGWETKSLSTILSSIGILALGHLAVAWNEEQVFRGYGFDSLRSAIGTGPAAVVLIPLFALYHGINPAVVSGMMAGGLVLTVLRLTTDGLWMPIAYHWAWNFVQTGILGAPDAEPSLRPMQVHGPALWIGHPGFPEPGLLTTLIHLAVAGGVTLVWWLGKRRKTI